MKLSPILGLCFLLLFFSCNETEKQEQPIDTPPEEKKELKLGAEQPTKYLPFLKGKKVALVVNQTSAIHGKHLVDVLLGQKVDLVKIFAPEHGFRGAADAGEKVKDGKDSKTGLPILSLYGKNKKPSADMLSGVEVVVFDIQDVGARFYTYISTMSLVMEACAENKIPVVVLDRPNPNGHIVDGPVLDPKFSSFVGMHKVPTLHGMTVGEYARMVNGEGWLKDGIKCQLEVVPCLNYTHKTPYQLPIKPSPNLPNQTSVLLYPHLCLFEGTAISVGRGTNQQFQVIGHPDFKDKDQSYQFTPVPKPGAKHPKHENKRCYGLNLTRVPEEILLKYEQFNLTYLVSFYKQFDDKKNFFNKNLFFDKLAGTDQLRKQILEGKTIGQIRASWQDKLATFKAIRSKYLLYK